MPESRVVTPNSFVTSHPSHDASLGKLLDNNITISVVRFVPIRQLILCETFANSAPPIYVRYSDAKMLSVTTVPTWVCTSPQGHEAAKASWHARRRIRGSCRCVPPVDHQQDAISGLHIVLFAKIREKPKVVLLHRGGQSASPATLRLVCRTRRAIGYTTIICLRSPFHHFTVGSKKLHGWINVSRMY
ncbi:hypothetical protein IG631_20363 [Alternaria alternata]|nr:hypothetical protein IG631_20363 [Alternaria alternata]